MNLSHDLISRAMWTAAQSFLTVLVAAGTDFVNIATWKAAAIAAGAAALSALKTTVQSRNVAA